MQTGRHDAPTEAGADPGLSLEEPPPPRRRSTGIGGRNHRNGWPASAGISGRDGPESVAGFRRNRRPDSTGIRIQVWRARSGIIPGCFGPSFCGPHRAGGWHIINVQLKLAADSTYSRPSNRIMC